MTVVVALVGDGWCVGWDGMGWDVSVKLSAVMKPETNLAAIYDDATELEQVFIKKLALFFTGEK